jgi:hypothetical protein
MDRSRGCSRDKQWFYHRARPLYYIQHVERIGGIRNGRSRSHLHPYVRAFAAQIRVEQILRLNDAEHLFRMNAMVCHITEGELRIEQEGKTFTAKKDFVWTCNKDTKEQAFNDGRVVAIMRITDLKA